MNYRTFEIRPGHYDDKEKRLSLAFVSEEPVRREFGYEVHRPRSDGFKFYGIWSCTFVVDA